MKLPVGKAAFRSIVFRSNTHPMSKKEKTSVTLSIRLDLPMGDRFGPGMAALLSALEGDGSIAAAAQSMTMSYPRALKLIYTMNGLFRRPLVETYHGGASHGGARLTETGRAVLQAYQDLRDVADAASTPNRIAIGDLLAARCKD